VPARPLPRLAIALAAALAFPAEPTRAELPGDPDTSFNGGQPVLLDLARGTPRRTWLNGAAVDAQGGIVVTGYASDENGKPVAVLLTRLGPDGTPDTAFGTVIQLGLGAADPAPSSFGSDVGPRPGGAGWLVVGQASTYDADTCPNSGLVVAFDALGRVDVGFGTGGTSRPHPASTTQDCFVGRGAIAADGATYVTGTVGSSEKRFALSKVTPGGSPDMLFGNAGGGSYVQDFAEGTQKITAGADVIATAAGLLAVGGTTAADNDLQLLVLRLTSAGSLDGGFAGGAGVVRAQVGDPAPFNTASDARMIAVGPDDEIYVGGRALDPLVYFAMSITRFSPAGALDGSFATVGTRRLQVDPIAGAQSEVGDLAVQPDGKLVAVGITERPLESTAQGVVLRLDVDGNLDPTFGTNGIVRLSYGTRTSANRLLLSPDGESVVVTGSTFDDDADLGRGFATRILLVPRTTTTTLPGGCAAAPSLAGARCRLALLGTAIAAVPPGKLASKLAALVQQADGRLTAAASATGKALRKKLKKATKPLRGLGRRLVSKAAENGIGAEQRADLSARTDALVAELQALAAAT
jgi:uncharacterized delta-60 repeat protein